MFSSFLWFVLVLKVLVLCMSWLVTYTLFQIKKECREKVEEEVKEEEPIEEKPLRNMCSFVCVECGRKPNIIAFSSPDLPEPHMCGFHKLVKIS